MIAGENLEGNYFGKAFVWEVFDSLDRSLELAVGLTLVVLSSHRFLFQNPRELIDLLQYFDALLVVRAR